MALPPRWAKASSKRSSGTRRPTNCSSSAGQRSRSAVEIGDGGEPVLAGRVDAAEEHAVLEDRVERERPAVERDLLLARVDAEQAGDAAAAQEAESVGHQLGIAGRLDDEVEAAELAAAASRAVGT